MKSAKLFFAIILMLIMLSSLLAVSYDAYPLGCYTYIHNSKSNNPFDTATKQELLKMISDMGFNLVHIDNRGGDASLEELLALAKSNNLRVLLDDRYYPYSGAPVNSNQYNVHTMTTASYLKFEAEYANESDVDGGKKDAFWYRAGDEVSSKRKMLRVGTSKPAPGVSNGYIWFCSPQKDKPGFAYTDPRWRWKNKKQEYVRVGYEFRIYNAHDVPNFDKQFVYFHYKIKVDNISAQMPADSVLFSLSTVGYIGADSIAVEHAYTGRDGFSHKSRTTDYHVADYMADYAAAHDAQGYINIEVKISYADLLSAKLLKEFSWWQYNLVNLNPRIFWKGNCDLSIDYIEMEGQTHYEMVKNPSLFQEKINERLTALTKLKNGNLIKFVYGFDEPLQGQYDSFNKVQSFISKTNPQLLTAAYDYEGFEIAMPEKGRYYDHVQSYLDIVKPETIFPDMYPIRPLVNYNDPRGDYFLQTELDHIVTSQYNNCKLYTTRSKTKKQFIPIIQVFGNWSKYIAGGITKYTWTSWMLPPFETQKCLLYLPLCYGVDGMLEYNAISNQLDNPEGKPLGDYSMLHTNKGKINPGVTFTRQAVLDAHAKINIYGPLTKELTWCGSNALMTKSATSDININALLLNSIQVLPEEDKQPYDGFVQCGYFKDDQNIPSIVLVNRRTNYFKPSEEMPYTYKVPADAYPKHYSPAPSQTVALENSTIANAKIGSYITYYDPYDSLLYKVNQDVAKVKLAPGDCKLLQMVATLPAEVPASSEIRYINQTGYLKGTIILQPGANVCFEKSSYVSMLPGTVLIIQKGATLNVKNLLSLSKGASIINHGNLIYDKTKCDLSSALMSNKDIKQFERSNPNLKPAKKPWYKRIFSPKSK